MKVLKLRETEGMAGKFDEFWRAYPRKVAKAAARKAFLKISPDQHLLETILNALKVQKDQWTDILYIPHAATWLNGERWEDEIPKTWKEKMREEYL